MEQERLQKLLQEAGRLRRPPGEDNIFSIGARGYYENPTSDLLAFFLDPTAEHRLGDLLLSCLVEFLREPPSLLELERPPEREYPTRDQNRIDLFLNGGDWVMAIENKLRHDPVNPFAEYRSTVETRFPGKRHYFVVLAPYDPREEGWTWVSYRLLLAKARDKLGARLIDSGISKWGVFLREFLIHLEDQLGRHMGTDEFNFVRDHYSEVVEVTVLHDHYISRLLETVTSTARETLGANPARVRRNTWGELGIALRVYPRADRLHNATRPNDADRSLFADGGRFAFLGDEAGRAWIFYKDESDLDSALNTLRASLSVLRNNTQ